MIFSSIHAPDTTFIYPKGIQIALEYLRNRDFCQMEPGTYAIQGKDIYAIVMDVTTQPVSQKRPEIHKRYVDVQFLVSGSEKLGFSADVGRYEESDGNEEKDIYFYDNIDQESFILAESGSYSIFFPSDIHRPGCMIDHPQQIRKVVVKIHISAL